MNDENDKPKDDGWGMTMPHLRYEEKKKSDGFADGFSPKAQQNPVQSSDDEWGMTTPNINLSDDRQMPPDFDKTAPNFNLQQDVWDDESPSAHQPPADVWGATTPNINIPQNIGDDDWGMDAPSQTPPKSPKKNDWSMPTPVFRVSEGEDIDDIKRTAAFNLSDLKGFDKDSMTFKPGAPESPEFNQPAPNVNFQTTPPPSIPGNLPAPPISESFSDDQSAAPTTVQAVEKKSSKLPLVIGGLLGMLLFAAAFMGGVYFLFFNKPAETATKTEPIKSEPVVNVESNTAPLTTAPLTTAPPVTQMKDLPKQIEYKGAMLLVAAGEFTMGSDTGADESKPAHQVVLPAYFIDKTEVTNAEYRAFCDATGKTYPPNPHLEADYFTKRPNAPVVGVTFADAKAYADWAGKRLPTEEEWEKAASWDEATNTKREYPWGNDFQKDKVAFGIPKISDVGKFSGGASPSGALDMAGNVLEWVDAYFQPYPNGSSSNPEFGEKNRVVRGGHFASKSPDSLKTTKRIYIPPTVASGEDDEKLMAAIIGFRCAVSADDSRVNDVLQAQGK